MRERSPTTKGFASLQGCMIFCKDKICWVIKHTQTRRLWPGDKESSLRTAVPLPLSLFGFFSSSLNLGFSSLEVTSLIEPRDQRQAADELTRDGKVKKQEAGGGVLLLETASQPRVGQRQGPQPPRGRKVGVEPWLFPQTPLLEGKTGVPSQEEPGLMAATHPWGESGLGHRCAVRWHSGHSPHTGETRSC